MAASDGDGGSDAALSDGGSDMAEFLGALETDSGSDDGWVACACSGALDVAPPPPAPAPAHPSAAADSGPATKTEGQVTMADVRRSCERSDAPRDVMALYRRLEGGWEAPARQCQLWQVRAAGSICRFQPRPAVSSATFVFCSNRRRGSPMGADSTLRGRC
jgi:hypothetical protein